MRAVEELQAQLADFRNAVIAAECCVGVSIERWNDLAERLLGDDPPTADERFGASAGVATAQRRLRELADKLGELGAAFDAVLRAETGEKPQ